MILCPFGLGLFFLISVVHVLLNCYSTVGSFSLVWVSVLQRKGLVLRVHRSPIRPFLMGLILILVKTPPSWPALFPINAHPVLRSIRRIFLILSPTQTLIPWRSCGLWWFVPTHLYFGVCGGTLSPRSVVNIVHRFGVLLSSFSLCLYVRIQREWKITDAVIFPESSPELIQL